AQRRLRRARRGPLRPARGGDRDPAAGRVRGAERPFGGRPRRRVRELLRGLRIEDPLRRPERAVIERIIELSARNKFLVLAATAALVALAIDALRSVPLDAIPDLSDTQVIVYSRWD